MIDLLVTPLLMKPKIGVTCLLPAFHRGGGLGVEFPIARDKNAEHEHAEFRALRAVTGDHGRREFLHPVTRKDRICGGSGCHVARGVGAFHRQARHRCGELAGYRGGHHCVDLHLGRCGRRRQVSDGGLEHIAGVAVRDGRRVCGATDAHRAAGQHRGEKVTGRGADRHRRGAVRQIRQEVARQGSAARVVTDRADGSIGHRACSAEVEVLQHRRDVVIGAGCEGAQQARRFGDQYPRSSPRSWLDFRRNRQCSALIPLVIWTLLYREGAGSVDACHAGGRGESRPEPRGGIFVPTSRVGYASVMSSVLKPPDRMTVAEFLAWDAPGETCWELVDGEPIAMAPTSRTHGSAATRTGQPHP